MKLNLYHNEDFTCLLLVNIDAQDNEVQSNRHIDSWQLKEAAKTNLTYWKNDTITSLNPHKFNRVRVYYDFNGTRNRKEYFCINDIIRVEGLTIGQKF